MVVVCILDATLCFFYLSNCFNSLFAQVHRLNNTVWSHSLQTHPPRRVPFGHMTVDRPMKILICFLQPVTMVTSLCAVEPIQMHAALSADDSCFRNSP